MMRIEFIGAPYVGKSFLFKKIYAKRNQLSSKLVFEQDLLNSSYQIKLLRLINKLLNIFFSKSFNFHDTKLNSSMLNRYADVLYPFFQQQQSLNSSNVKDILFFSKCHSLIISRIKKYETVGRNIGNTKTLIVEESILHWHLVLKKYFYSNFKEYSIHDESLKAIIYCYAPKKVIKERFKLRSENNLINSNHRTIDEDEVFVDIIKTQQYFLDLTDNISKTKPVLKINTADDIELNLIKVINFLNENS